MRKTDDMIPLESCKHGFLYKIHSRNLGFGVYNEKVKGFIGIREKFGYRFLDTEYHWDTGAPHGTACPKEELQAIPEDIQVTTSLGTVDRENNRPIEFDKPVKEGGKGWYYTDTGEAADQDTVRPMGLGNQALFAWLNKIDPPDVSKEELEKKALKDFEKYNGKVLFVSVMRGRKHDGEADDDYGDAWKLDPPVRVRILDTPRDRITYFREPDFMEPRWNFELLETREELKDGIEFWVEGIVRNQRGKEEKPDWVIADPEVP